MSAFPELDALIAECEETAHLEPTQKGARRGTRIPKPRRTKADIMAARKAELDRVAADMRQRNLTRGKGCAAKARAIEARSGSDVHS